MSLNSIVGDLVGWVKGQRTQQHFHGLLLKDHVLDGDFASGEFKHDQSYFKLRLTEMHLRYERNLWFGFLPLCLVAADYFYDGERRSMPFLVSHERLKEALARASDDAAVPIELLNTSLVGPVPFMAGDVGLAVALFRTQSSDLAELLLDVLGGLAKQVEMKPLTDALPIAGLAYDGVKRLLGMTSVQFRFGMRDEFRAGSGGGQPLQGGYLVLTNAPRDALSEPELWVKGGRLHTGRSQSDLKPFKDHDFCVVAIEHHATRGHYGDLPFHQLWAEIPKMIWDDQVDRAEKHAFPTLGKAIVTSPDLVEEDKAAALTKYTGMFYAEIERHHQASSKFGGDGRPSYRGGKGGAKSGVVRLKEAAGNVDGRSKHVSAVLNAVANRLIAEAAEATGEAGAKVDVADEAWRRRFEAGLAEARNQLKATPVSSTKLLDTLVDQALSR